MKSRSGPSPTSRSLAGISLADPGEDADHVADPFDRSEIGGVHQDLLVPRRERLSVAGLEIRGRPDDLDEIGDDPDLPPDVEFLDGAILEIAGNRRHSVGFLDGELDDPPERRVGADQGDIRAVEGGQGFKPGRVEDLLGQVGAGRMGDRVMGVDEVEALGLRQLHEFRDQTQLIRGVLEQRIGGDFDLMDEDILMKGAQAKGRRVAHDMQLVPFFRKADGQFRGHDAASPVGRIADDADLHGTDPPRSKVETADPYGLAHRYSGPKNSTGSLTLMASRTRKGSPYFTPI